MAKQKGRLLLVKIGDGNSPETFNNLCGLTTKTVTINNNAYDVTTADCTTPGGQLWREVQTGMRSISISGNGYFEDATTEATLRTAAYGSGQSDLTDAVASFQVVIPDFGTFEGTFHIDSLEYGGAQEDGVTYSISLSSSGYVSWTSA